MSDLKRTQTPGPVGGLNIPTWVVPKNTVGGPKQGQSNNGMDRARSQNSSSPTKKK